MTEQRKPELLILDLDSTLIDTGPLFSQAYDQLKQAMLDLLKDGYQQMIDAETFVKKFFEADKKNFSQGRVDIRGYGREIIKDLLTELLISEDATESGFGQTFDQLEKNLLTLLEIFDPIYEQVPQTLPDAVALLTELNSLAMPFIICSHSGQAWLALKIAALAEECGFDLPFFAVELDEIKDELALRNALDVVNQGRIANNLPAIDPQSVWVVGDSLKSDIYSAFFADFAGAVWINWFNKTMSKKDQQILASTDAWHMIATNALWVVPHLLALTTCYNAQAEINN